MIKLLEDSNNPQLHLVSTGLTRARHPSSIKDLLSVKLHSHLATSNIVYAVYTTMHQKILALEIMKLNYSTFISYLEVSMNHSAHTIPLKPKGLCLTLNFCVIK